jgi:polar amino acid transport system permease protein
MTTRFDWALTVEIMPKLLRAAEITVSITVLAYLLCLVGGGLLLALRRARTHSVARCAEWFMDFVRSTPLLPQLYFFYFAMPSLHIDLSPYVIGVVAVGLHYSCYISEVYRAGLEAVPKGQWEAAAALGLPRFRTFWAVIRPQAVKMILPAAGSYLIYMFKETPLLAAISVPELMFTAAEIGSDRFQYLEPVTVCGALFLVMSIGASQAMRLVERWYGRRWTGR